MIYALARSLRAGHVDRSRRTSRRAASCSASNHKMTASGSVFMGSLSTTARDGCVLCFRAFALLGSHVRRSASR